MPNGTSFENQCAILSELWMNHRADPGLSNFMYENDLGLPLAFAVSEELVLPSDVAMNLINETFEKFLDNLGANDEAYTSLDDLKLGEVLRQIAKDTSEEKREREPEGVVPEFVVLIQILEGLPPPNPFDYAVLSDPLGPIVAFNPTMLDTGFDFGYQLLADQATWVRFSSQDFESMGDGSAFAGHWPASWSLHMLPKVMSDLGLLNTVILEAFMKAHGEPEKIHTFISPPLLRDGKETESLSQEELFRFIVSLRFDAIAHSLACLLTISAGAAALLLPQRDFVETVLPEFGKRLSTLAELGLESALVSEVRGDWIHFTEKLTQLGYMKSL